MIRCSTRRTGVAEALACALVLAVAGSAGAQPEVAEAAFAEGREAFQLPDYERALELFRRAFAAAPHDAVRFNVAVCLDRLGRFREAWIEYRAAAQSRTLSAEDRARAAESGERMRARLAVVRVEAAAPAELLVDGAAACTLPCEIEIDPGEHRLGATISGRSVARSLTVGRGERVTIRLEALPAAEQTRAGRSIGWLSIAGGVVGAAGIAGVIGFGVRAQEIHDAGLWRTMDPPLAEGALMRDLANVSIGVAALGAVLIVIDALLASAGEGTQLALGEGGAIRF